MAILPETPGRLATLTEGMTEERLHRPPEPETWSVNDVLAHLRACDDVLGGNMLRIVAEDRPAWKGMSPRTWMKRTDYPARDFRPSLEAFATQRAGLLAVLEPLTPEGWERTATVSDPIGRVFEYTTRYYGDWLAGHERAHLKYLPKIVAAVRDG